MNKIKRWLILKLGGQLPEKTTNIVVKTMHPITFRASYIFDPHLMEWEDYDEKVRLTLATKLATQIYKNDIITYCYENDDNNNKILTAELKVMKEYQNEYR